MYTHLSYDIMFKLSLGCVFKEQILILITGSASNFILRCTNDAPLFSFHLREQPLLFIDKIDPNSNILVHSRDKFSHIYSQCCLGSL